jgi:hypothetical protein
LEDRSVILARFSHLRYPQHGKCSKPDVSCSTSQKGRAGFNPALLVFVLQWPGNDRRSGLTLANVSAASNAQRSQYRSGVGCTLISVLVSAASTSGALAKIAGFSLFSAYRVGERVLAWVAEVAKNPLQASDNAPDAALASAVFRYIRLTRFAYGGNLGQPGLARFGKFRKVFFDAGAEATLAGLNSRTLRLDIGCTGSRLPPLLRHCNGCGK